MPRRVVPVLALVLVSLVSSTAAAKVKTEVHGSYRVLFWNQSDLNLGLRDLAEPVDKLGQTNFVEHRLRVGSTFAWSDFEFDLEVDAVSGLLNAPNEGIVRPIAGPEAGAPRPEMADPMRNRSYGLSLDSFALRRAMFTWKSNIGNFAIGPTTFQWGEGMLSNSGGTRDTKRGNREVLDDLFADRRFGDRSFRAMYATKPLYYLSGGQIEEDLTSVIGFDLVLQDETSTFIRPSYERDAMPEGTGFVDRWVKDRAMQAVLALKHTRGGYSSGIFATRRWLSFAEKPTQDAHVTQPFATDLEVWAVDIHVEGKKKFSRGTKELYGAVEGALVAGSTNYVRNSSCTGQTDDSRCSVFQQGLVARGGLRLENVTFDLLGGYASGDGNPFDDSITNFRFDRDFKVGMVLFDQVVAWQSAAGVRRGADPRITNEPNAGIELLSSAGAITNAVFVNPTVRVKPAEHTTLLAGVLWAAAPQRYSDAFWTTRTSQKTNAWGQAAGANYGLEFDLGASYARSLTKDVELVFGVQGGYFLPGDAFLTATGETMDSVYLAKVRTAVVF